ncbi:glycosyltransferase [Pseudomaricurvus alkylphenolicus]|uniref:glycosyltransferase n=1 Tax=Pseudomaricurvus alkylphenolicus TaxID=1306991 RepID=UPI001423D441|nr:glycosyltransferase [Pseudomaricurvus alkylphenolicus]NIB42081.1 glycosyltransferase [Pseudomaricurvus alkylphenolicus]
MTASAGGARTNVLHVYKTAIPYTMGGVEQVLYQLTQSTAEQGFCHQVLTLHDGDRIERIEHQGVEITAVPWFLHLNSTPLSVKYLREFRRLREQTDILHYHFPFPLQDLAHLCLGGRKKPSVLSYHSDVVRQKWIKPIYTPVMHRFLGSLDAIVAASPQYAQSSQVLKRFADKVEVIPYGLEQASYPETDPEMLEHLASHLADGFFLFVGVLRYYKGLEFLIEAARKTGLPVVIAGDGPLRDRVEMAAGQHANIHYLGQVTDSQKSALLKQATAFVFPSHLRAEAFGISLLEAAMYGKPLISADISTGTTYINQHQQTGLVVPPGSTDALMAAMAELWNDSQARHQYGAAARERYLHHFTQQRMGQKYSDLYRKVQAGRRS